MEQTKRRTGSLVVGLAMLLITGCAASRLGQNETPGAHFDRVMKEFAENCAKTKLKPNDTACDILKLKPADPLATEEGRFAHSINIPNPLPTDSGYKPGMTPEEYFEHLCKTEAGEFVLKTIDNVEGIMMLRPRGEATDSELENLYVLEDPYGYVTEGAANGARNIFVRSGSYQFVEEAQYSGEKNSAYRRYMSNYNAGKKTLFYETSSTLKSRYGYTWRGIHRPHDRELGIAGGELILLDLQQNEVIAMRRGYLLSGDARNNMTGVWWLGGYACPKGNNGRTDFYTFDFVRQVLKPVNLPGHEGAQDDATK